MVTWQLLIIAGWRRRRAAAGAGSAPSSSKHGRPAAVLAPFGDAFAFDVGATTPSLETDGVGGELFANIGVASPPGEQRPRYVAWLPDRRTASRPPQPGTTNGCGAGSTPRHLAFWRDGQADARLGPPAGGYQTPQQRRGLAAVQHRHSTCRWGDIAPWAMLRAWSCARSAAGGLLSMLLEDTVHA